LGGDGEPKNLKKKQFGGLSHSNLKKNAKTRKNTRKYMQKYAKMRKYTQQGEINR
jgi:hypothetical protein